MLSVVGSNPNRVVLAGLTSDEDPTVLLAEWSDLMLWMDRYRYRLKSSFLFD